MQNDTVIELQKAFVGVFFFSFLCYMHMAVPNQGLSGAIFSLKGAEGVCLGKNTGKGLVYDIPPEPQVKDFMSQRQFLCI